MEISGQVSYDVAATYAWKLYEAFQLAKIIQKGFSHMVEKVELIENDGGVGTILELTSVGGQGLMGPQMSACTNCSLCDALHKLLFGIASLCCFPTMQSVHTLDDAFSCEPRTPFEVLEVVPF
ncbi:uncharacterized protein LOC117933477 isoform X2 [Vitis riparia]|uniref:uncharacterized protein LOC117933477 isoform X2 n=1 Tax=Vitis riparia TaxID=96939 RepID=UPI00155AC088|nr:uncharacterized protein LOC117933477 isoform X2 [Vitis riparia]